MRLGDHVALVGRSGQNTEGPVRDHVTCDVIRAWPVP